MVCVQLVVFSVGMAVYWAADYRLGQDEELQISSELDAALSGMCEEDASFRMSLQDITQVHASWHQASRHTGLLFYNNTGYSQ